MKTHLFYIAIIIIILATRNCNSTQTIPTKTVKQTVEYSNKGIKSTAITAKGIAKHNTPKNTENGAVNKNDSINAVLLAENEMLKKQFLNAPDTTRTNLFNKSIQISDFEKTTDTTLYKLRQFGKVRGEVLGLGFDIELKPQRVTVPKKWSVLAGAEATSKESVNGKVFYYSKSGIMYFGSYSLDGSVGAGVAGRVFGN
jgi:hypothetical protein